MYFRSDDVEVPSGPDEVPVPPMAAEFKLLRELNSLASWITPFRAPSSSEK
jgi:hypothetical protein